MADRQPDTDDRARPLGNRQAERGLPDSAAPDSLTDGQTPDRVKLADPAQLEQQRAETADGLEDEARHESERQLKSYEDGRDDGKRA